LVQPDIAVDDGLQERGRALDIDRRQESLAEQLADTVALFIRVNAYRAGP
jgi:hypothetical protein